ncbi:MAG: T9SS type A sorting domain-containing protein [Candidatus Poribacteria bacterium]|nr:T9SS type A sorting domain-containing protein [Candidatus Poribacteria bacterium]
MKTTKFVSRLMPILVLSLVCSFTFTAVAQNHYPAEVGNMWVLLSTDGTERRTYAFEGPETVDGQELILLNVSKETVGTDIIAFDKSWITVDEDGGHLLHQVAFDRGAFGIAEATYDTPVLSFPAALPLGQTWVVVTETVLKLVGAATTTSTLEVVAIEDVETPIGVFKDCVKVETNRRAVTALSVLREHEILWLAPDVGPVKFQNDQEIIFELESYNLVAAPPAEEPPAEPEVTEEPTPEEPPAEPEVTEEPTDEEVPVEPEVEEPPTEEAPPTEEPPVEPEVEEPMPEPVVEIPVFDVTLEPGLNMISIPLMPAEPHTAKSLAEMLNATIVIRLDVEAQSFVGYTVADEGDGFGIDGGQGYVVNTPEGGMVKFTGQAWDNQPKPPEPPPEEPAPEDAPADDAAADDAAADDAAADAGDAAADDAGEGDAAADAGGDAAPADAGDAAPAAPALTTFKSAWAFIVTSDIHGMETGTTYTLVAENLRTGTIATENVTSDVRRSSAVWADLNRKSVVEAGDKLKIALYDERGTIVSGPFQRTVATADIRDAFLNLELRVGDVRPEDTILAQNFPNPFNPETWIPYQLSQATEVSIQIYNVSGHLVRSLDLGWQATGSYMTPSSAAYWDGRNAVGERVASGIYFYTLQTADFTATRRMVILK